MLPADFFILAAQRLARLSSPLYHPRRHIPYVAATTGCARVNAPRWNE